MARGDAVLRLKVVLSEHTEELLNELLRNIKDILDAFNGGVEEVKIPTLGRTVHYRGKEGVQTLRAAIVSCTLEELDQQNVLDGNISDLDDEMHVHLHVITPGARGHFEEFNVAHGTPQEDGKIPPGTWCWPKMV